MTTTDVATRVGINEASARVLFHDAHTAYAFDETAVTEAQLAEIYELTRHAPTAMNSQPLRVTFLRSEQAKQRLLPHLAEGNRAKALSAPVVAILAADTDFHENLPRVLPHAANAKDKYADPAARERAARFNATLQTGYFILAVRAVGLDAGPMGGFNAAGVDAEFFAGSPLRSLLVVNIGHAAATGTFPRQPRLDFDEATTTL